MMKKESQRQRRENMPNGMKAREWDKILLWLLISIER
jgi:hypothetical protein